MQLIIQAFEFIVHIDVYLRAIIQAVGPGAYAVLFLVVFAETGFVVTPFLPGDSLLFAAGTFAGIHPPLLDIRILLAVFISAALIGDNVNYWVGRYLGPRVLKGDGRILKRSYLDKTQHYFDRYGARTVVIARFVPIVRTFCPFMAGVGKMSYPKFLGYATVGLSLWVAIFVGGGFFFGGFPAVRDHFTLVILGVIAVSMAPGVVEVVRHRLARKDGPPDPAEAARPSEATDCDE